MNLTAVRVRTMFKPIGTAVVLVVAGMLLWPNSASAASHPIPFHATFLGTGVLTSPTTASFAGTGIATQMGQITTVGNAVVTGVADVNCGGLDANTNVNTETLTAANGDTLT